jgi:hypothetical protein
MDSEIRKHIENLRSQERELQNQAFFSILKATEQPVDWAYEVWDELVEGLRHKDNHVRAISAQCLCNLAKSDPQNRMQKDFTALMAVTRDDRFVTARHCLQAIWKAGASGKEMQETVVSAFDDRFRNCGSEKNCTLIRYDIIVGLKNLYDEVKDEKIRQKALELIETETDLKYKQKYARVWK